ncbi:MAG: type II toxin-antitoxin system VapB family antitoxin [Methylobacter sp.]|nr:type II toxin-antitoxin system VapB family antitoxin [Methylobacter sp.]MDO9423025.1 type II toxin-antitoxin system VapB family antitoxin [Methylobacter sp.]
MQTAKLFQNGQSQAVRLPKSFRFEGTEVTIKHVGEGILLLPLKHSAKQLLSLLDSVDETVALERNQPLESDSRDFQ